MLMLGLQYQPFSERPAGHEYYFDPVLQMQLNMLQHNLKFSDMLQVLKGDPGSGKTALVIQMLRNASDEFQIFVARGTRTLSASQVITGMVKIFQQPVPDTIDDCVDLLIKHLQIRLNNNLSSVLILENAHEIVAESLNQLLAFVDEINEPLDGELRVLLIGEPSIEETISELDSKQISEGKLFVSNMRTLDRQRTQEYIEHRLRQVGLVGDDMPLTSKQYDVIHDSTGGLPQGVDVETARVLNKIATQKPVGEQLSELVERVPLRIAAGAATCILVLGLALFAFDTDDSMTIDAGVDESVELKQVDLAPTIISENDEPVEVETFTDVSDDPIQPNVSEQEQNDQAATITLLSELNPPPNNQFAESHGLTTPGTEEKTEENVAEQATPEPAKPEPPKPEPPEQETTQPVEQVTLLESESWLLKRKPERFTVQLLATPDRSELERYARKHDIEKKTALFRTLRNGKRWFVLSYGLYVDAATARAAINKLPGELRRNTPWIRSLKSVQDAIENHRS